MQLPTIPTAMFIIAQLSMGVQANYDPGKAAQLNFYTNDICTKYTGELAFWHKGFPYPLAGTRERFGNYEEGQCLDFRLPTGTKSMNTANCWGKDGKNLKPWCECWVFDNYGCKGKSQNSVGHCLPNRSEDGWQWKSAKCMMLTDPK